jgi:hypothetical protein
MFTRRSAKILITVILVMVVALVALFFMYHHTKAKTAARNANLATYCVGQSFASGSSGHCVSDIQTLVNYMEHSGLTECKFSDGTLLGVNGTFDSTTATQVKSVQAWADCYADQEGFRSNVKQTSSVNRVTWSELCTYGYSDPKQSSATGATNAIAAGQDAGCAQLPS